MASPVTWLWTPETDETGAACAETLISAPQAMNAATAYLIMLIPICSHFLSSALIMLMVFRPAMRDTESTYDRCMTVARVWRSSKEGRRLMLYFSMQREISPLPSTGEEGAPPSSANLFIEAVNNGRQ